MNANVNHRPSWAEVSLAAIANNVAAMKAVLGTTRLMGVVKANGYGHGIELAARVMAEAGVDWFGVATVDEGIELRESTITAPILILAEVPEESLRDAITSSLTLTIGSLEGASAAIEAASNVGGVHAVHLKVDTGMHRMGVDPSDVSRALEILEASAYIDVEGIWTHCSVADGSSGDDRAFTRSQIEHFDTLVSALGPRCPRVRHVANSAGALGYPGSRYDLARVGLALYGYLPRGWLSGNSNSAVFISSPC